MGLGTSIPGKFRPSSVGTILISLGDMVAVDMPIDDILEPLETPIKDSRHPCFSR